MIHRFLRPNVDSRSETIWLTIYADLMTNLVLVFLALYGLTVMGNDALARAIQSMKLNELGKADLTVKNLDELSPVLIAEFQNRKDIHISEEADSVRIQFGEETLFDSGKALLKPSSIAALQTVSKALKDLPYTVVVEGHTDPIPLQRGSQFRDNWELSLARSMSVVEALKKIGEIPENRLATAAYGQYRPRATNETTEGRRINRRVEIALFRDFSSKEKP